MSFVRTRCETYLKVWKQKRKMLQKKCVSLQVMNTDCVQYWDRVRGLNVCKRNGKIRIWAINDVADVSG